MPAITAVVIAQDDALRIGRALETIRFPSEILVVSRVPDPGISAITRQYGARLVEDRSTDAAARFAMTDWLFFLAARETVSEALDAVLMEWSLLPAESVASGTCYAVQVREELASGWISHPEPETRLVHRSWQVGRDGLPVPAKQAQLLEGALCRFAFP